jgi:ectoine hydroxylase-related dioxygenase (phytanoyl-CoA dioxygenase family)
MHLIPQSFDSKIGRSLASRHFPAPTASDLSYPPHLDGLSDEELRFFAANGYLVRHGVIPAELANFARRFAWSLCPRRFDRDAPESWRGRVRDSLSNRTLRRRRGCLKFRENIRNQDWLYELVAHNKVVHSTASALLGDALEMPKYVRGLYSVFPSGLAQDKRPRPHTDGHPFLLGTTTYLNNVLPEGGGFTVWPGSHLNMRWAYEHAAGPGSTSDYHQRLYKMATMQRAVEITGDAGTVIFWHHRLAHCSNFNRSDHPRHAVMMDFGTDRMDRLVDQLTPIDPWRDWAIGD